MPKSKNLPAMLQPDPIPGDRLLTTKQASELTGLAVSTLNAARITGTSNTPPFCRIGNHAIRYRLSTVQAWIAGQTEYRHTSQQQAAL